MTHERSPEPKKSMIHTFGFWIQVLAAISLPIGGFFTRDVIEQLRDHDRKILINTSEIRAITRELVRIEASVLSMETRIKGIEGTRFKSEEGAQVRDDISKIWIELSQIKGRLPEKFPPPETERRIEKLEDRILEIERRTKKD